MPSSGPVEKQPLAVPPPAAGETGNSIPSVVTANGNAGMTEGVKKQARESSGGNKNEKSEDTEKSSSAELKKKKQAEKAARQAEKVARRAQVKQSREGPAAAESKAPQKADSSDAIKKTENSGVPTTSNTKGHHKRTSSIQKSIPSRPTQASEKPTIIQSGKDVKKVALFGHLYGQPRRTTVAAAGKDVHPAVLSLGLQMSSYVLCGSSVRCVATLLAFKRVIESYVTPPGNSLPRHLTSHLSPQIEYLISCRPLSTSMGNAIRWLKLEINDVDIETPESTAKADLCEAIDNFIRERITVAGQVIAASAAQKIQNGDIILTFAKSNIVQQTLIEAHRRGIKFTVIVIDSRPLFEGRNLASTLGDLGLEVRYSLTHAVSHLVKDATKVFLGANAMLSNGRLYSRAGSAIVAMMAKEADVPVIICCESIKFTDKVALDSIVTNEVAPPDELIIQGKAATALNSWHDLPNLQLLNPMYDVTPAEFITMVITEYGSLPPSSVPVVHRLSTNT